MPSVNQKKKENREQRVLWEGIRPCEGRGNFFDEYHCIFFVNKIKKET
jgi:hypothetical protein